MASQFGVLFYFVVSAFASFPLSVANCCLFWTEYLGVSIPPVSPGAK